MKPAALLTLGALSLASCAHLPLRNASEIPILGRRPGSRDYVFTSSQATPAGLHQTRLTFTLRTGNDGTETATITDYESAAGEAPFAPAHIDSACSAQLAAPAHTLAELRITPPPHELRDLLPACVPEAFWGAASDILPLLMIQVQPRFRADELRRVGDRLPFAGYEVRWQLPPNVLDARVRADSGVIALDSLSTDRAVITWDTSPMMVDIVRRMPSGQGALLHGHEWFLAVLHVDPRTGELVDARTRMDSLVLHLRLGYAHSAVPEAVTDTSGFPVRIVRRLNLRRISQVP